MFIWWLISRSRIDKRGRRIRSRQGDRDAEKSFQKAISITTAINGPEARATTPYYDEKSGVPGYDSVTMLAAGITHAGTPKELGGSGGRAGAGYQRAPSPNTRNGGNDRERSTPPNIPYGKELGNATPPIVRDSRVGGVRYDPTVWGDSWRGVNRSPSPGIPDGGDLRGSGTISPVSSSGGKATYSPFPKPLPPQPAFHGGRDVARDSNNSVGGNVGYNGGVRASYGLGIGIAK